MPSVRYTNLQIPSHPQADTIGVENGIITQIGQKSDVTATKTISLEQGVCYPGFTDGHLHFIGLGAALEQVDLSSATSPEEAVHIIRKQAETQPEGSWILGRSWDQNRWPGQIFPNKQILNREIPKHPVYMRRVDGHAGWVNSLALKKAGIDRHTPNPPGGRILRNDNGEPSGLLIDTAEFVVQEKIPKPDRAAVTRQMKTALHHLHSLGFTGAHDAGTDRMTIDIAQQAINRREFPFRLLTMLNDRPDDVEPFLTQGIINDSHLQVRTVKLYLDGALGSRGAALLKPYTDDPDNDGLLLMEPAELDAKIRRYNDAGFQTAVHCIGDRANRIMLDTYEQIYRDHPEWKARRNRIEHAQIIHPEDISRFADLEIIAAVQPTMCTSDFPWTESRLGPERLPEAYPWQSLLRHGAILIGSSDAPVEAADPLKNIHAAVSRQDEDGKPEGGWQLRERVTLDQALAMFSRAPAYAAHQEHRLGNIAPGYVADFTVLSQDLQAIAREDILNTKVRFTIVDGDIVYAR